MTDTARSPHGAATVASLLRERSARLGHQPLLTYYDDRSGERTELSYATFDNWVSKSANLLVEDLGLRPGQVVSIAADDHWTGWVVTVAAWRAGAAVRWAAADPHADVVVVPESAVSQAVAGHPSLVVVGDGLGGRLTAPAPGVAYGDEVLAHDDHFEDAGGGAGPAVLGQSHDLTHADLLDAAAAPPGVRVLTTGALREPAAVTLGLVAPLVAGGSSVWCPRAAGADMAGRATSEKVSAVLRGERLDPV